jgi:hypothetical protein
VDPLEYGDLVFISSSMFPNIDAIVIEKLIDFNIAVHEDVVVSTTYHLFSPGGVTIS